MQTIALTGGPAPGRSSPARTTRRTVWLGLGAALLAIMLVGTIAVHGAHSPGGTGPGRATVSTLSISKGDEDAAIRAEHLSIQAGDAPMPTPAAGTAARPERSASTAATEVVPAPAD